MRQTFAPVASLLTGVGFLITGYGLQLALVPLRAAAEGWTTLEIGLIGSAYYLGFVAGCFAAPPLILRAGHIRAFTAMVSMTAATIIAHPLWVDVIPWFVFRLMIGMCLSGLYMIIESWLNDRATNATRGLIMSAYIAVVFAGITVGQFAVTLDAPTSFSLFAIATIATVLATIPVALTRSAQPAPITVVRFRLAELYHSSPVGVVGVASIGVAHGAFWTLGAVSAVGEGLSAAQAAIFMSIATAGGALMQWPAGRLSDRVDRRLVLISLLSLAVIIGLAMAFVPVPRGGLFVLALLFGMTTLPTYAIAAAHAYDRTAAGMHVETAAGILLANAVGAIVGPLIASPLMEAAGASKLFLFTALVQACLVIFTATRMGIQPATPPAEKTEFDLAATAAVGAAVTPELPNVDDPLVVAPPSMVPQSLPDEITEYDETSEAPEEAVPNAEADDPYMPEEETGASQHRGQADNRGTREQDALD
jgi:MFS family permease